MSISLLNKKLQSRKIDFVTDISEGLSFSEAAVKYSITESDANQYFNFCTKQLGIKPKKKEVSISESIIETSKAISEFASESAVENSTKKKKKYVKLSSEAKKEIIDYCKNNPKKKKIEIAKKYDISAATLSRILCSVAADDAKEDISESSDVTSSVSTTTISDDNKYSIKNMKLITIPKTVDVGLINERHNIPVKEYIFQSVSSKLMFDYKAQEDTIEAFLDVHNLPNSGTTLRVFVTGLVCCNASVIKICIKKNVKLIMMHFNKDSNTYIPQAINAENEYSIDQRITYLSSLRDVMYIKNNLDVTNLSNFNLYEVKVAYFKDDKCKICVNNVSYLTDSTKDCFEIAMQCFKQIIASENNFENFRIFVSQILSTSNTKTSIISFMNFNPKKGLKLQ